MEKLMKMVKRTNKKRGKNITLIAIITFLLNNFAFGEDYEYEKMITGKDKDTVLKIENIEKESSQVVLGLGIETSENITVKIDSITTTVKVDETTDTERAAVYGLTNFANKTNLSNGLKVNAKIEGDFDTGRIVGINNTTMGDLKIGERTEINVEALGNFKELVLDGINVSANTNTEIGSNSEINVSSSMGRINGIGTATMYENTSKITIGDNVKIKAELLDVNNTHTSKSWAIAINNQNGETITAGNGLVLGVSAIGTKESKEVSSEAINNLNGGKIKIGNGSIITSNFTSEARKFSNYAIVNNKNSELTIGDNAYIEAKGKNSATTTTLYNGNNSTLTIREGATITVDGDNISTASSIYTSDAKTTIGNGSNINAFGKNNNFTIAIYNVNKGNTTLNGGTNIYSDKYAIFNTGGNVLIEDTGYTKKIQGTINSKGVTSILLDTNDSYLEGATYKSDGGIFDLGLKNKAVWYVLSASGVSKLDMENGIVDMTQNHKGETVDESQYVLIDNATGSGGTYILDISPEDKDQSMTKTDGIYITKADAPQNNYVQAGKTSINGLVNHDFSDKENSSIMIGASDKNVTFEGKEFSDISNVYDYTLSIEENVHGEEETENIWYVTGINKKEGEVVEKVEEDLTLNYMNAALSRLEVDTIHKRLGEIRDYTSENGVWARIVSGEMEHDKSSGKFKNDYNMLQVGYDKRKETEKGSVFTGFAVHKRDGKTDFRNGDGKNHNIGISMYKSFAYNDNSYTDIILKYSHLDNDYKSYTENNQKLEADYNTWAGSLSLEHGKKYEKNAWYVTPHVQMNYTYVKGADYSMNSGVRVEQRDIKSLIGRAGIYAGHDFKKSSHFVKAGVLHEFAGEYGAKITGEDASLNKKYSGRDTWVEVGIGGQFKVGKTGTTHLYYDVEKTFESDFETNWQASVGVRIEL